VRNQLGNPLIVNSAHRHCSRGALKCFDGRTRISGRYQNAETP
jgi:hypothetical protein